MELSEQQKRDLGELQNLNQQMQLIMMQRQQFAMQKADAERVLADLSKQQGDGQLYRFAGTVLVARKKDELVKEIQAEKESLELREAGLAKQEAKIKERALAIQKSFSVPAAGKGKNS